MAHLSITRDFSVDEDRSSHEVHARKITNRQSDGPTVDGIYMVTPLLLGVAVGLGVDHFFSTNPWGFLVFLLAGTLSSFYNMFVLIRSTRNTAK